MSQDIGTHLFMERAHAEMDALERQKAADSLSLSLRFACSECGHLFFENIDGCPECGSQDPEQADNNKPNEGKSS